METAKTDRGTDPGRTVTPVSGKPPRIDPLVLARQHESLQGCVPLSSMTRLMSAGVAPQGTLDWQVEGSVGRDEMKRQREFLRVRTTFEPWMTCSRCLEPIQVSILVSNTRFRLAASEEQAAAEDREAEDREAEVEVIAAAPGMDLAALVEDEAILALPMAPAHQDCEWETTAG